MSESSDLEVLVDLEILSNECNRGRRILGNSDTGSAECIKRIFTSIQALTHNEDGSVRSSPPPNCAICLGKLKDKSFTDICLHPFCFKCLLEWSKVKNECPLCKQEFRFIVHNVKSENQYDQHPVGMPIQPQPRRNIPIPPPDARFTTNSILRQRWQTITNHSFAQLQSRIEVFLNQRHLINDEPIEIYPDNPSGMFLTRSEWLSNFRRDLPNFPPNISNETMSQLWRHYVYNNKLMALPLRDITGRYRDCTASFYRENPAQIQRLIPFLHRELTELVAPYSGHRIPFVLNTITELITIHNMNSSEFRRRVRPFILHRTNHFVHEFVNFARSPYDLIGYDREVRYLSTGHQRVSVVSSGDDSDGSGVEHILDDETDNDNMENHRSSRFGNGSGASSSALFNTVTTEDDTELSVASTSQAAAINLSTHNRGETSTIRGAGNIYDSNTGRRIETNVIITSSSDECEFVLERPPPHLRTPELVSLNSDSEDSDCVFISEIKPKVELPPGIHIESDHPFTDSDASSNYSIYNRNKNKREKKNKTKEKVDKRYPRRTRSASLVKDDYNGGPSTSSGLRSYRPNLKATRSKVTSRRKYYALLRMSVNDTIFENSSSDEDGFNDSQCYLSESSGIEESDESWSKNRKRGNPHKKRKLVKTEPKRKRSLAKYVKKEKIATKCYKKRVNKNKNKRKRRAPSTSSSSSEQSSSSSSSSSSKTSTTTSTSTSSSSNVAPIKLRNRRASTSDEDSQVFKIEQVAVKQSVMESELA